MKPIFTVQIPYKQGIMQESYERIVRWFNESTIADDYHIVVIFKDADSPTCNDWTFEIVGGTPAEDVDEPTQTMILESLNEDYKPRDDFR